MIDRNLLQKALVDVIQERHRQDHKFHDAPEWYDDTGIKLAVLMEEVGEVARSILENETSCELRAELTQVAAVAVKWVESIYATDGVYEKPAPDPKYTEKDALTALSLLSSYVGTGIGDDSTTAEEYERRIRWGIDFNMGVLAKRAEQAEAKLRAVRGAIEILPRSAAVESICFALGEPDLAREEP